MGVIENIQSLITAANATTGKTDADMTEATKSLILGYGGGGGGEAYTQLLNRTQGKPYTVTIGENIDKISLAYRNDGFIRSLVGQNVTVIEPQAFYSSSIVEIKLNEVNEIRFNSFWRATALQKVDVAGAPYIGGSAFRDTALGTLIIRSTNTSASASELSGINCFENTPIANGTGYIYVPKALVEQYKVATNWSNFATQIRAIEDYPEITGG